jgi:hypothetical protein
MPQRALEIAAGLFLLASISPPSTRMVSRDMAPPPPPPLDAAFTRNDAEAVEEPPTPVHVSEYV